MSDRKITSAVIVTLNAEGDSRLDAVYGGETLLNRALVALSKSGMENVSIICHEGRSASVEKEIRKVSHRITLKWKLAEKAANESLSEKIRAICDGWSAPFILLESDCVWHPTALKQAVSAECRQPLLFCHKNVSLENGRIRYFGDFKDKYKVIFENSDAYRKIAMRGVTEHTFGKGIISCSASGLSLNEDGLVSAGLVVCDKSHFRKMPRIEDLDGIIGHWMQSKRLRIGFISDAWWLKITGKTTRERIKRFFWGMAFKEISGEFSKLVNSRLSKPATFLFVKMGFSPNAVSIIEIILFILSSAFLIVPDYWGMIVFAVIWQLSAGVLDRSDGEVARIRNYESAAGARFDMLIDDLRFALPLLVLGVVCYLENPVTFLYPVALAAIMLWYVPTAMYQQIFMYRSGYVSVQALGIDLFKAHEKEIPKDGWQHKIRPVLKGDIRTFYVFLLCFAGSKPAVFWLLFLYELGVGIANYVTVRGMRHAVAGRPEKSPVAGSSDNRRLDDDANNLGDNGLEPATSYM